MKNSLDSRFNYGKMNVEKDKKEESEGLLDLIWRLFWLFVNAFIWGIGMCWIIQKAFTI